MRDGLQWVPRYAVHYIYTVRHGQGRSLPKTPKCYAAAILSAMELGRPLIHCCIDQHSHDSTPRYPGVPGMYTTSTNQRNPKQSIGLEAKFPAPKDQPCRLPGFAPRQTCPADTQARQVLSQAAGMTQASVASRSRLPALLFAPTSLATGLPMTNTARRRPVPGRTVGVSRSLSQTNTTPCRIQSCDTAGSLSTVD